MTEQISNLKVLARMKSMTNLSFFCDLRDAGMAVYEDVGGSR